MERKTTGLMTALAGVAALGTTSAQAATNAPATPHEPLAITSYADLLQPIPNAVEALKASDAALRDNARNAPAKLQQTDWGGGDHHHHHHHHEYYQYAPPPPPRVYYAPPPPPPPVWYHHHHHHHAGAVIMLPGIGVQIN
ncbi:hypothetical protein [Acidocella aminolytica]|uniref:Uncharacterized protein n=1 Tax=Acidocella aminolytica 101 = DSM 11237 TaxID=1120923 RepID=A0A0D6PGQ4_9PROT|nr:hypothetical protein [Acidocella aminolytica]GAN80019.1 hypothetical protein Aam_035_026 [Acidocella aminolytica 101 = DSM 11237]GBQ40554.1 hypothetical protein AA11237_2405 [Acidocella aminolytica 101 = DSM 11237]SHF08556.1 hypothetical protein SAMN02746095_02070 [Acidocella aminolytica 101 = DSM 11237]